MRLVETSISGLILIEPKVWKDERGHFFESFNKQAFSEAGLPTNFVQDNQSLSHRGALRGLHAQADPFAQGKLVRVIRGSVIDIAIDIRKNSPTYGKSEAFELSAENHKILWIPPGFLHGFATLEDNTIFTYKVTNLYNKASEIGVRWNDPQLNLNWHLEPGEIILSEKDKELPLFSEFETPFD